MRLRDRYTELPIGGPIAKFGFLKAEGLIQVSLGRSPISANLNQAFGLKNRIVAMRSPLSLFCRAVSLMRLGEHLLFLGIHDDSKRFFENIKQGGSFAYDLPIDI